MKVFYTPVIDGEYNFRAQRRLEDQPDNDVYRKIQELIGDEGIDQLDDRGYVKVFDKDQTGLVKGYWTYQQDDL